MKCRKCGELASDFAQTCPVCGASLSKDIRELLLSEAKTKLNPTHVHQEDCTTQAHSGERQIRERHAEESISRGTKSSVGIVQALVLFFRRFVDFKGRSRRSEFWWPSLIFYFLTMIVASANAELGSVLTLALFVPSMAVSIRRLHDVGKSAWWYLVFFVPCGVFVLLYWLVKDSDPEPNAWGDSPKY